MWARWGVGINCFPIVISIPFTALHSTHTALKLKPPQSPLFPCCRNISFLANLYPLQRGKFNNIAFEKRSQAKTT